MIPPRTLSLALGSLLSVVLAAGVAASCSRSSRAVTASRPPVLADTLKTRPIAPDEAAELDLDSTRVRLGFNMYYQTVRGERDVVLVERIIFAIEFSYQVALKLDSLGLIPDDQVVYLITRQALVRGGDSAAIAEAVATEPIVWHQSLPPEVSGFCIVPAGSEAAER